MLPILVSLCITFSGAPPSRADSRIVSDARNVIATTSQFQPGDELVFPGLFKLATYREDKHLAARMLTGGDRGKSYYCALAIDADTEVKFQETTHWQVFSHEIGEETQRLVLVHDQFGPSRPLELRCTGPVSAGAALYEVGVAMYEHVPVESIDNRVPAGFEIGPEETFP